MKQEDIIAMAREADIDWHRHWNDDESNRLERFAALVAAAATEAANARANTSWALMCEKMVAAEKEACAKVCDELHPGLATKRAAEIIRARGQA
jgi:hypothetical protein